MRVATVTLRANMLPYWLCHDSGAVAPGNGPVPSSIASGCAGISMAHHLVGGTVVAGAWLEGCAMMGVRAGKPSKVRSMRIASVDSGVGVP